MPSCLASIHCSNSCVSRSKYSLFSMPSYTTSVNANQNLAQVQNVLNDTANGSAFVSGVTANNNTSQFGQNNLLVI